MGEEEPLKRDTPGRPTPTTAEVAHLEQALRESEERTRLIVAHALDAVITMDLDGRVTSWNPQAEAIFGWPAAAVLGRLLSETIVPPEHRAAHERGLAHFRHTGEGPVLGRRLELTALRRDGTTIPVELAITPLPGGGATVFSAFLRDITERKQAEQALATYAERLKILHDIDLAIIATSEPVAIAEAVLERLRDLLGVPRAIVNLFDLAAGEAEWLAAVGRRQLRVGSGIRFPMTFMGDVEGLRRGEVQLVDTRTLPPGPEVDALLASDVQVYRVVPMIVDGELIGGVSFGGASADISEARLGIAQEVATQLAIALAQARLRERDITSRKQTEQLRTAMSVTLSHELNTPLNRIVGFAEVIESDLDSLSPAKLREMVEMIRSSAERLRHQVARNLDFARLELLRTTPFPAEGTEVTEAVQVVVQRVAERLSHAHGREADLVVDMTDGVVAAAPRWVDRLLSELLDNAFKFSAGGSPVRVLGRFGAGRFRLSVRDAGRGMSAEQIAAVAAFQQFDRHRYEQQGVGLGLYLARGIAECHGGELELTSEPGKGTTAVAALPSAA